MIRKTELTDKIEAVIKDGGYDERLSYLLNWADSLPDDVPQGGAKENLMRHLVANHSRIWWEFKQSGAEHEQKLTPELKAWSDAIDLAKLVPDDEPLNQNHAGSNEPGFDPKTTQDLSQKADVELFPVAFMYLERGFNEDVAIQKATAFIDLVRAEEARRAAK